MSTTDDLDRHLNESDPVRRSSLSNEGVNRALDDLGAAIAGLPRRARAPARRRKRSRSRAVVILAAVFAATATVAAAAGLSAHTGRWQPTPQQIASASPEDAARMQSEVDMGGPGELLDPTAPDYRDVALQVASDIPYPHGFDSWRDYLISREIQTADPGGVESSGALHGWFAASAFCAWIQDWRRADLSGDTGTAADAAHVISAAPSWEAVTDEDPHPDPSVPGDFGTTYSLFGWMLPYRDAVLAGDRAGVEHLLASAYGDKCWTSDPDWSARIADHPEWRALSPSEMAQKYEQYLADLRS
jgi:hypothetical protein